MDTRLTADQRDLFDTVRRLTTDLGLSTVADLDDAQRRQRLDASIDDMGVRGLRAPGADHGPLASGVEAALVAEALGAGPADAAYLGPLLAGDLLRRAGLDDDGARRTVVMTPDLGGLAVAEGQALTDAAVAVDAEGAGSALVGIRVADGVALAEVDLAEGDPSADLTRRIACLDAGHGLRPLGGSALDGGALAAWSALGLSVAAADAVGAMRAATQTAVDYTAERRQYGAPVGSFQAVQHLLADAHTLTEGALSITRYASWAVDALAPDDAWRAAAKAAAYVGRAQREVAETVIQVHGGIGNTWECMAHVYLRRMLHDDALLGTGEAQLSALADRIGA